MPPRRFVGRSAPSAASSPAPTVPNQIPEEISNDPSLKAAVAALLPPNYSFEVPKTIWHIRRHSSTRVALQLPEGLSMFACALADLVENFTDAEAVVLGDVTYGACCIDDYTARALGCDMLVHYGHSCLIPVDVTTIRTLYIFVEIGVDVEHLVATVRYNFPSVLDTHASPSLKIGRNPSDDTRRVVKLAVVSTVQFLSAIHTLKDQLESEHQSESSEQLALPSTVGNDSNSSSKVTFEVHIPQVKPLSAGEILGCTSPRLPSGLDAILYVGDGRFHLESIMVANPTLPAYRYDPYEKRLTLEEYDHQEMQSARSEAIDTAHKSLSRGNTWGVILGTLGRQGSLSVLQSVTRNLKPDLHVPILMSELSPQKLASLSHADSNTPSKIDIFVQSSCPRLSIDWGYAFPRPLLSPYEANIACGKALKWTDKSEGGIYRMDFYADESAGIWTPRHEIGERKKEELKRREERKRERQRLRELQA